MSLTSRLEAILREVRREHAPDLRTSVYEIAAEVGDRRLSLVGATSVPAAAEELHRRIALLETDLEVEDRIERLPLPQPGRRSHAIVTAAVAPMLAGPAVTEPHISQALLGHRLLILRGRGRWYQCRAQDGYLGWIHRGYIVRVDEASARGWEIGTEGEPAFSLGAEIVGDGGGVAARLPWAARFMLREDGSALLPDGRAGRPRGDWVLERERSDRFAPERERLVQSAMLWVGAPYLWGGVTPAGVDCSGLAQVIYRTHGVELPRDSDQQAGRGEEVEPGRAFADLLPGDLLFFAEDPGRITHVTISTGGSGIVHSSLGNGGVAVNDMMGNRGYERELRRIFVCAKRILNPGW